MRNRHLCGILQMLQISKNNDCICYTMAVWVVKPAPLHWPLLKLWHPHPLFRTANMPHVAVINDCNFGICQCIIKKPSFSEPSKCGQFTCSGVFILLFLLWFYSKNRIALCSATHLQTQTLNYLFYINTVSICTLGGLSEVN